MEQTFNAWRDASPSAIGEGLWGGTIRSARTPELDTGVEITVRKSKAVEVFISTIGAEDFSLFEMRD